MRRLSIFFVALLVLTVFAVSHSTANIHLSESKVTDELLKTIEAAEADDLFQVYVVIEDVDSERVMKTFQIKAPEAYEQYNLAKETNESKVNSDLLQLGIETKRSIYAVEYYSQNKTFADLLTKEFVGIAVW